MLSRGRSSYSGLRIYSQWDSTRIYPKQEFGNALGLSSENCYRVGISACLTAFGCFPSNSLHIKSSNILLDDEYVAKISDFGASQLSSDDTNEGVPYTWGYLDPQSMITGQLTEKSDVYSFAVVILELLMRKTAIYSEERRGKRSLAQTFSEEGLENILDNGIRYEITREQIEEFSDLLRMCLRETGEERPTMTKIVAWLMKMREFDQNLSEEKYPTVHGESNSNFHDTYTAQYCSSERQAVFELDYSLTR